MSSPEPETVIEIVSEDRIIQETPIPEATETESPLNSSKECPAPIQSFKTEPEPEPEAEAEAELPDLPQSEQVQAPESKLTVQVEPATETVEEQAEPHAKEPEESTEPERLPVCSNCCEQLSIEETPDLRKAVHELLQGPEILKISHVLNRVLKLGHLKDAFLEEGLEEDTPLCPSCASILGHLNVLYTEFFRVQAFESYLSKKIERLDEIIRRNVTFVEIQPEIEFDTVSNAGSYAIEPVGQDSETLQAKTPKKRERVSEKKSSPKKGKGQTGPWVVITRLRPRDLKKANVRVGKGRSSSSNPPLNENYDSDGFQSDFPDPDPDFHLPKTSKKRKMTKCQKSKAKSSVSKASATLNKASKKRKLEEEELSSKLQAPKVKKKKSRRGGFYETFFKRKMLHPFPCIYCKSDFDTEEERVTHLKESHCEEDKVIICGPCGKVFAKEVDKEKHMPKCGWVPPNFHPPPYICEKCGKEFESWLSLSGHRRQVCSDRKFNCDQCSFTAKTNGVVLAHKRSVHEATEKVPCPECPKLFKTEKHLKCHLKHMHTTEGRERYQGYQQRAREKLKQMSSERRAKLTPFCAECNIDFQTVHRFISHYNAVHETKKWQCEQCGKSFAKSKVFRKHVRITHSDARPYVCDQCGNSFKSMTNLQTHLYRVHTEEGRLKNNEYYRESRRKRQKVVEALSKAGPLALKQQQQSSQPETSLFVDNAFLNRGAQQEDHPEFLQFQASLTADMQD